MPRPLLVSIAVCVSLASSVLYAGPPEDGDPVLVGAGARDFLVTGIDRDGTGRGPDVDLIAAVRAGVPGLLLAAGGVGSAADVGTAVAAGADAVVVGKAMLDGRITFA